MDKVHCRISVDKDVAISTKLDCLLDSNNGSVTLSTEYHDNDDKNDDMSDVSSSDTTCILMRNDENDITLCPSPRNDTESITKMVR